MHKQLKIKSFIFHFSATYFENADVSMQVETKFFVNCASNGVNGNLCLLETLIFE